MNQIHMLSHLAVVGWFWSKHIPCYWTQENAYWNLSRIIRIVSDLNSRWCPVKGGRELCLCFEDSYSCFASYRFKCIVCFYTRVDFFLIRLPAFSVVCYWKAENWFRERNQIQVTKGLPENWRRTLDKDVEREDKRKRVQTESGQG